MPVPGEYKTVQARILAYAQNAAWTFVPREETEQRSGFEPRISPIHADYLFCIRHLRPSAKSAVNNKSDGNALPGQLRQRHTDIYGIWREAFDSPDIS